MGALVGERKERSRFQRGTSGNIGNIFWPNNPMKSAKGEREGGNGKDGGRKEGDCGRDSISKSDKGGEEKRRGRMTTIMGRTGVGTTC